MVPLVDLSRHGASVAEMFAAAAARIAASGRYLLGDELESFEAEWARWTGVGHVAGVGSGASAIQLALTACGVGRGDEVLIPAFTAVPTASAVIAAGATPVAVDVDPDTACMDFDSIPGSRTDSARAAIVVHLYGRPAPLPDSRPGDLVVIEDAAQAAGALHGPLRSHAAAYSFYPTKNLGGIGDGGAVVTEDAAVDAAVRTLRAHGMTEQYVHESISQNFRMSEIEAAWLRIGLTDLHDRVDRRRRIAAIYRLAAPDLLWQRDHPDHAYHLCVFRTAERESVRRRLAVLGVATAVHYPLALTQQPAYRALFDSACPVAERWAAECVTVPCFPEMTDSEIDRVASALAAVSPAAD